MQARLMMVGIVAIAGAAGCANASLVAARAAGDLGCPEKQISVTSREMNGYEATGCGKSQRYMVRGGEVMQDSAGD